MNTLETVKELPVVVYDNLGATIDRYTIMNMRTGEVFHMSENALSPQGVNMFAGLVGQDIDHPQDDEGQRIELEELPEEVLKAITRRYP